MPSQHKIILLLEWKEIIKLTCLTKTKIKRILFNVVKMPSQQHNLKKYLWQWHDLAVTKDNLNITLCLFQCSLVTEKFP